MCHLRITCSYLVTRDPVGVGSGRPWFVADGVPRSDVATRLLVFRPARGGPRWGSGVRKGGREGFPFLSNYLVNETRCFVLFRVISLITGNVSGVTSSDYLTPKQW